MGPKLDDTQIPPEEVNVDSQAQTSGPEGIRIFAEQLWAFGCRRVLRNT